MLKTLKMYMNNGGIIEKPSATLYNSHEKQPGLFIQAHE